MIRFIRLLFYHIYVFYNRKEGKSLAKFSTFLVFIVICSVLITTIYDLIYQYYDINYTTLSGKPYIIVCVVIGIIIAYYLYKESFQDFNENYDYNKNYYYYFFIIIMFTLGLFIYGGKVSRERIFKQRELQKEHIENKK
ncbi:hypothetical protein SAMN06265171_1011077 [Chryseobacterium rhizoplanae]|uniref:Uncharacterized protein n=1 Tax=Chryseobacterium rhizoplanae TaxID=1609531 RepID=A0A521BJW0_9FLAO|nr:hypothetical protein [Chryseobacterium rhizoplanae]SMO47383.1 hypothetical protein SAMN06265171_1011077 [Chryseobacterium rhizoplanae]